MPLVRAAVLPGEKPPADADGDMTALLADLHSDDSSRRRQAVRGLALHPWAVPALCARLGVETAASVRSVIFTVLIGLLSAATVHGLLPLLRSEDVGLRNAAIEALQQMPDSLAPCVGDLLADNNSDVRICTVNVLGALADRRAPRWLEEVLRHDPHVNVCAAAVEGLAELGDAESRPALEALPKRFPDEPFIAFVVKAALQRIGAG